MSIVTLRSMEQDNKFTDQSHWDDYWANFRYDRTPTKVAFQQFTKRLTEGKSLIEIGGFPGKFFSPFIAIYARK